MFADNRNSLLGVRVRRLRDAKGQTQNELAANAGVSLKHLGEIERGRGNPSLKSLQGLAEALGISLSELFDTEQEKKSDETLKAEIIARLDTAQEDVLRVLHRALKP